MSMYTRCPHCETYFRVTREQLQLSSGQVRCGRCQQVFDAFATLSSQLPAASEQPPGQTGAEPPTTAGSQEQPRATPATRSPPAAVSNPSLRERTEETARATARGPAQAEILTLPYDLFSPDSNPSDPSRTWPWVMGTIALLLVLAFQGLYFFGTAIASHMPELRPQLVDACRWLHCTVSLPRMPDQLFIEASDLQVLNSARPSEVLLTVTIRNRAHARQDLPLIELTLTDAMNQTAARKVFYPADYVDAVQDRREGIGPNQEIPVKLYLDTGRIRAAGYRLYLFFV